MNIDITKNTSKELNEFIKKYIHWFNFFVLLIIFIIWYIYSIGFWSYMIIFFILVTISAIYDASGSTLFEKFIGYTVLYLLITGFMITIMYLITDATKTNVKTKFIPIKNYKLVKDTNKNYYLFIIRNSNKNSEEVKKIDIDETKFYKFQTGCVVSKIIKTYEYPISHKLDTSISYDCVDKNLIKKVNK